MQRLKKRRSAGLRRVSGIALFTLASFLNSEQNTKASNLTWDASGSNPLSPTDGGGIWSTSASNWSNGSGDIIWPNDGTIAVFGNANGQAGPVQLASATNVGGLIFNPAGSGNYTLQGNSLNLSAGTIVVNQSNPVLNVPLAGSAGLIVSGSGSLTLDAADSYTGSTNVSAGTLVVNATGALSGTGLTVNTQATAELNSSQTFSGGVVNHGTLNISSGQTLTVAQGIFYQYGTLNLQGTLIFNGSVFADYGGTINGTVSLNGSTSSLNILSPSATGSFQMNDTGAAASAGGIYPGITVSAQPTNNCTFSLGTMQTGGIFNFTAANNTKDAVNFSSGTLTGSVTFSASGTPAAPISLSFPSDTEFDIRTGSSVAFNTSAIISGHGIDLEGTLTVNSGATVNTGFLNISSASMLTVTNGTLFLSGFLNYTGGTIIGNVNIVGPAAEIDFDGSSYNLSNSELILASNNSTSTILVGYGSIPSSAHVIFQPITSCTLNVSNASLINNGVFASNAPAGCMNTLRQPVLNYGTFSTGALGLNALPAFNNQTGAIAAFNGSTNVSGNVQNRGIVSLSSTLVVSGNVQLSTGSFTLSSIRGNAAGSLPLLSAGSLTLSGTTGNWASLLDLGVGDLIISSGSLSTVNDQVRQGFHSGDWLATAGISSTAASNDSAHLTAVGVIQNNQSGSAIYGPSNPFHNTAPATAAILAGLTYYGDANLDGKVDGSDYSLIDSGWLTQTAGWFNGDFNYDGIINGSDYALIDNAFNRQGAQYALATDSLSNAAATVPEPSVLAVAGLIFLTAGRLTNLRRRK